MKTNFERTVEWNNAMGVKSKGLDNFESIHLGLSLVKEELEELEEELFTEEGDLKENINLTNTAKELGDMIFVVNGLAHRLGINLDLAASRVCDSNDSKFCNTMQEAVDTVSHYKEQKGVNCYIDALEGGKFAVKRYSDDKVMKAICYEEADMYGTY